MTLEDVAAAEVAIRAGTREPEAYNIVAWAHVQQGQKDSGLALLRQALRIAPQDPMTLTSIAILLHQQGRLRDAILYCDAALAADPDYLDAWLERGQIFTSGSSAHSAIECFEHVLRLEHDHAAAHAGLAAAYGRLGDRDKALSHAAQAFEHDPDNQVATIAFARALLEAGDAATARDRLRAILARLSTHDGNLPLLANLLGDAEAKLGAVNAAFDAYVQSKRVFAERHLPAHAGITSHYDQVLAATDALRQTSRKIWHTCKHGLDTGGRNHVFVLGYPRSGNTLMENILASLPGAAALEERPTLGAIESALLMTGEGISRFAAMGEAELDVYRRAYWDKVADCGVDPAVPTFVDMDPLKSLRLPAIARLFPQSKVIWMRRDPRDVVWSCFHTFFAPSSVSLEFVTIKKTATHFAAVMELIEIALARLPLQILPVDYHKLVADFDTVTGGICDFIGVPWDPVLRQFDRTAHKRGVSTASVGQVRLGLYDGTRQWEPYAEFLEPVLPILARWI